MLQTVPQCSSQQYSKRPARGLSIESNSVPPTSRSSPFTQISELREERSKRQKWLLSQEQISKYGSRIMQLLIYKVIEHSQQLTFNTMPLIAILCYAYINYACDHTMLYTCMYWGNTLCQYNVLATYNNYIDTQNCEKGYSLSAQRRPASMTWVHPSIPEAEQEANVGSIPAQLRPPNKMGSLGSPCPYRPSENAWAPVILYTRGKRLVTRYTRASRNTKCIM